MIKTKTVLVLGAGASKPYGFPTGAELVSEIANDFASPRVVRIEKVMPSEYRHFVDELRKAQPSSIDEFLENHPSLGSMGKKAIALHLLPAEDASRVQMDDINKKDHWYRYLKAAMNAPFSQWGKNQLRVITFNYDRSLEYYLFRTLMGSHEGVDPVDCATAITQIPILHIYGSLGPLDWQSRGGAVPYGKYQYSVAEDEIETASQSIKTLCDGTEAEVLENFARAKECLAWADRILFLGFGFHEDSVQRLALDTVLRQEQEISGTCHGLDNTRRSKVEYCTKWAVKPIGLRDPRICRTAIRFPSTNATCYDFLYNHVDLS